jgi:hypothetical protein
MAVYKLLMIFLLSLLLYLFSLWNYNTTNDNTHGDHWNGEDFSIFSLDSPKISGDSPNGSLRQQAPNFAKEVMKRAALERLVDDDETDVSNKDSNTSDNEIETLAIEDDSPFDRAYLSFDHEESDDGRDHVHHVGGRALDAVVVSQKKRKVLRGKGFVRAATLTN